MRILLNLILIFFSITTYANCPSPNDVRYICATFQNQEHCNWSAPWYEGFPESNAKMGDIAQSFSFVFWGVKNGDEPLPGHHGSTICFYESPYGNMIKLVQNNWGRVIYPNQKTWQAAYLDGFKGRICTMSFATCNFDYPLPKE